MPLLGEELLHQPIAILGGDLRVEASSPLGNAEGLELLAELIDADHHVEGRRVGVASVEDADQLRRRGAAVDREDRAAAVSRAEERVDDEVAMAPAALGVLGVWIHHLADVHGGEGTEREAAHLHQVAGAQRRRAPDAEGHHGQDLARLHDGDVGGGIGDRELERNVAGLVVVLFVADDLELLADLLAARRDAVHGMIVVGHVGAVGDVLVGYDQGFAVLHLVGEAGPVHDRTDVVAAELAIASVVDALVGGDVADGEDELVLDAVEDLAGASGGNAVRVVAFAERRGRGGSGRASGRLGGRPGWSCRLRDAGDGAGGYQQDCKRTDHALASSTARACPGSKK